MIRAGAGISGEADARRAGRTAAEEAMRGLDGVEGLPAGTCLAEGAQLDGATLQGDHTLDGLWEWKLGTMQAGLMALGIPHGAGAVDAAARVIADASAQSAENPAAHAVDGTCC